MIPEAVTANRQCFRPDGAQSGGLRYNLLEKYLEANSENHAFTSPYLQYVYDAVAVAYVVNWVGF